MATMPLRLRPFPAELAGQVAGWAAAAFETTPPAPVSADRFGLFHDDRLIAYGEVRVDDEAQEVELERLIVDPGERGHGIGRRLVAELIVPARRAYPRVLLRVHPDNTAARRWAEASGFEPLAARGADWLALGPERVSATRRVAAPAEAVFDLISDPDGHVRLDGSGMLVAAATATRLTAVGDAFEMEMDREALGDLPMGRYRTRNVITRFEPGRCLEWTVGDPDGRVLGHVYGYELAPVPDGGTDVTSYCDWSAVPPASKSRIRWPVVPVDRLERSLANLDRLVTGA